jgi:hypothetical protein
MSNDSESEEPYKEEISKLLDITKFAIIAILVAGGVIGQQFLL